MVTPRDAPAAGRLAGRRVVVTGAARGIGAAIAQAFAGEGARLALMDREGDQCRATAAQLGALALDVDLADPTSACDAMQAAVDGLGGIDILVNNAGILHMAP
ncbi:MAG: SDR family NAD(P)-dependent oxidoreductase, partial [Ilumatobacteraceae bacterium]|nr:SDR family NAD(P)-dependent oxidoreductase [Ilumatobacteraceae bacterium]